MLNFLAPEHGKGECDGETAIMKNRVDYLFKKGSLLMTLEELCEELRLSLSIPSRSVTNSARAIHERRFISVPGKFAFFRVFLPKFKNCNFCKVSFEPTFLLQHDFSHFQWEHFLWQRTMFWEDRPFAPIIPFWLWEIPHKSCTTKFCTGLFLAAVLLV
jgi:hypothetical protein